MFNGIIKISTILFILLGTVTTYAQTSTKNPPSAMAVKEALPLVFEFKKYGFVINLEKQNLEVRKVGELKYSRPFIIPISTATRAQNEYGATKVKSRIFLENGNEITIFRYIANPTTIIGYEYLHYDEPNENGSIDTVEGDLELD